MKESTRKLITWAGLIIAGICTVLSIVFAMKNGDVKELSAVQANGLFDATFYILLCLIAVSIIAIFVKATGRNSSALSPPSWWSAC